MACNEKGSSVCIRENAPFGCRKCPLIGRFVVDGNGLPGVLTRLNGHGVDKALPVKQIGIKTIAFFGEDGVGPHGQFDLKGTVGFGLGGGDEPRLDVPEERTNLGSVCRIGEIIDQHLPHRSLM